MSRYLLAPAAEQDLREIWDYIADDSEQAADALVARFKRKFEIAAHSPFIGQARPDLAPAARMLVEGSYLILYRPEPYGIAVMAVVHAMTNPKTWLE